MNSPAVEHQISRLLWAAIKKIPKKEQIPRLMQCLETHGYIIEPTVEQPEEDPYADFIQEQPIQQEEYYPEIEDPYDLQHSYQQQQHSSITTRPFAERTYIQGNERLSALNVRGLSSEEQDYNKVREQLSNALDQLHQDDTAILDVAMNMYLEIKKVYTTTKMFKGEIKGSIRNGYILLVLYYALLSNKICVQVEQLSVILEISLSDLPKADKNIKMIFGERPGYSFINKTAEICLCNMRKLFDLKTIQAIEAEIKQLKQRGKISNPSNNIEIAAIIHHITKRSFKVIGEFSGISDDTIRKKYNSIF